MTTPAPETLGKYPRASTESLAIIEANECNGDGSLATRRFEACFNRLAELEREVMIIRSLHEGSRMVMEDLERERDAARAQRDKMQERCAKAADDLETEAGAFGHTERARGIWQVGKAIRALTKDGT